jgi:hypothetical protein
MTRIPVSPPTVAAYLQRVVTDSNYQLFYGINGLSDSQFASIMDALLNGDCQPEELVRLGTFSSAEADSFIENVLGNWVRPSVAAPSVGTDGYQYLTVQLGLSSMLVAAADPPVTVVGPDPGSFLGVAFQAGAPGGSYVNSAAIDAIFMADVLPVALGTSPYAAVFPSGAGDVSEYLLVGNGDSRVATLVQAWYALVFAPLEGISQSAVGTTIFSVNGDPSVPFQSYPGLAQWVLSEPEVPPLVRLMLLREAAVRTSVPMAAYSKAEVAAQLTVMGATVPGPVATSRTMAYLYFWTNVMGAAIASSLAATPSDADWLSYAALNESLSAAYGILSSYRLLLRKFLGLAYTASAQYIQGSYPGN